MNKKIVFTIILAFVMSVKANAGNKNPASIEYVQSQITTLLNYVNSKISNIPVTPIYTIGQHALGGIVFYIDSSGTHGLVAANNQFASGKTWNGGENNNITVNSTGDGIRARASKFKFLTLFPYIRHKDSLFVFFEELKTLIPTLFLSNSMQGVA